MTREEFNDMLRDHHVYALFRMIRLRIRPFVNDTTLSRQECQEKLLPILHILTKHWKEWSGGDDMGELMEFWNWTVVSILDENHTVH